jgi:hypothetical protein
MRRTNLPGHALRSEGAAYERGDETAWVKVRSSWTGVALCECGETSLVLESNRKRKAWHGQHKQAVLGAFDGAPGHG